MMYDNIINKAILLGSDTINDENKDGYGILFDLDGTLWDSSACVVDSWNEVLEKYGKSKISINDMHGYMGKTMEVIAKLMLPDENDEERNRIFDECSVHEIEYLNQNGGILFDGLENTLNQLSQKYRLFIVSNCQVGYIEAFLNYHQLGKYFTDIESYGNTGMEKGDNIKLVVERNHLKKSFYLGDVQGDLNSADYAGIPFVHAAYGFGKVDREVEKIDSIKELVECAEKMFEKI